MANCSVLSCYFCAWTSVFWTKSCSQTDKQLSKQTSQHALHAPTLILMILINVVYKSGQTSFLFWSKAFCSFITSAALNKINHKSVFKEAFATVWTCAWFASDEMSLVEDQLTSSGELVQSGSNSVQSSDGKWQCGRFVMWKKKGNSCRCNRC